MFIVLDLRRVVVLFVALGAALVVPSPASAGYLPGEGPGVCASGPATNRVGTNGPDRLVAGSGPERIYGLAGSDQLVGGATQASCLFGGRGPDFLGLGAAGGVALGEDGADVLFGSPLGDAMSGGAGMDHLLGGDGRDVLRGDAGIDHYAGGPGDDAIVATDGRSEIVACGSGDDAVVADARDALFGCEQVRRFEGETLPTLRALPSAGTRLTRFRITFRAPHSGAAGSFVVLGAACRQTDPVSLASLPAAGHHVKAGDLVRARLRAPAGGWCVGSRQAAVVRTTACVPGHCVAPLPAEPVTTVRLRVR